MEQSPVVPAQPVARQATPEQVREPSPSQPSPGKANRGVQLSRTIVSNTHYVFIIWLHGNS